MFAKWTNRALAPPSPLLPSPWREASWEDDMRDLQYVKQYQPEVVPNLRVLLYGPVGAGKSSFINSVSTTLRGRSSIPAGVSATKSNKSYTKKYETHRITKETRGNFYPIFFDDIMGLEDGSDNGIRVEDIKLAMMGHINDGYKFSTASALSHGNPGYNPSPSPGDKAHVLVCVHSASCAEIKESVLQKMREVRDEANDLGIPQVAVLTKIDEACEETEKDLKDVYRSEHLKKTMSDFSSAVGIPMHCIFPVRNYTETSYDADVEALILGALRRIVDFGDDFLTKLQAACVPLRSIGPDLPMNNEDEGAAQGGSQVSEDEEISQKNKEQSQSRDCVKSKRSSLFSRPTLSLSKTVRVSFVVTGQTFGAHLIILDKVTKVGWSPLLTKKIEISTNLVDSNILIIFCPITSRVESDVETAIQSIQDLPADRDVILVLMHHTWKADYSTGGGRNTFPGRPKVVLCVDVLFHGTLQKGFLNCQKNDDALQEIQKTILKYSN